MTDLFRGVCEIFPENLEEHLKQRDRPLRIKLGIDPTGSELHLGHSILLRKLRAFQDAGHIAVLIIGDFTAQIGDPTGKSEARKKLTREQITVNARTYINQVISILDFDNPENLELHYNSKWHMESDFSAILDLMAISTVGQMLAKEAFAERYRQGNPIHLHEFIYPLMQGYDSFVVDADIELGGTDQKFNIAIGRDIQRHFGQTPQFGLLMPILIGTDGTQKMSKSLDNYVGLSEDALSMYSKLEKTPDALILQYFELLTDLPLDELPEDPRDRQKLLALEIVTQYHGREPAIAAQKAAGELVRGGSVESDAIPEFSLALIQFPVKAFYLVSAIGLCKSSSDARRQIEGGAVRLDGEKLERDRAFDSPDELHGKILQFGKSKFIRLVILEKKS